MSYQDPVQTLIESFSTLADEVQNLIDRKTILEHKLRYSHEQYQYLADKYAPAAPEISETLAKLQLPPDLHPPALTSSTFVPLPKRGPSSTSNHQIALVIREGRMVVQQLAAAAVAAADTSKSGSSKDTSSPPTATTMTTVLEQDFTVEGKKGKLGCPFSTQKPGDAAPEADAAGEAPDPTPHQSADPICAAMFEEVTSQPAPASGAAAQCPIRFLDQHSPEEIAHYVETHKHQIPRSHEVCVKRYQKSQEQIQKLDAKYGNLVSMINDLSKLHQPMLPSADADADAEAPDEVDRASNERVETWAQEVSASAGQDPEHAEPAAPKDDGDLDREGRFGRPLKEVRVGESPSRPWGISVPVYETESNVSFADVRPASLPAAPVRMPTPEPAASESSKVPQPTARKCPFDHTKLNLAAAVSSPPKETNKGSAAAPAADEMHTRPHTPLKHGAPPSSPPRAAFISPESSKTALGQPPQMLFTGPVFIGYPIEQAMQLMQQWRN